MVLKRLSDGHQSLVATKFHNTIPLAEIVDVPSRAEFTRPFELEKDGQIQIYGVGELIYNFAEVSKKYFFKSDDMELFFITVDSMGKKVKTSYVFSWADGKEEKINMAGKKAFMQISDKGGISYGYRGKDSLTQKYFRVIKIPFKDIGIRSPKAGVKIGFDVAIGDADDYFVQKNKLSWNSSHDLLYNNFDDYGQLELVQKNGHSIVPSIIQSLSTKTVSNWGQDDIWKSVKPITITKEVHGSIKNKYDLSSQIKTIWNQDTLCFFIETQDSQRKRIGHNTIKKKQTFCDYGWIENSVHEKVWEMHASNSFHAGGALKNHKVDTVIHLKKGKYYLKYVSDESHAWGNWDDDPPSTPFYGVVVYKQPK